MEGVRHHLVGCVKYGEYFDVRAFRARAGSIVRKCVGEGRSVIVVGGSNYYAQALVSDSLMDVRDGDEEGYISDECSIDDIRLDGGRRTATEDRTLGVDASTPTLGSPMSILRALRDFIRTISDVFAGIWRYSIPLANVQAMYSSESAL